MKSVVPVVVGVVLALCVLRVEAQQVTYEGGLSTSTGSYFFTERTNSYVWSTGINVGEGRWSLRATLPIWFQNTTLLTTSGAGPVPSGGPAGRPAVHDSGQGREQRQQGGNGNGGTGGSGNGPGGRTSRMLMNTSEDADVVVPDAAVTGFRTVIADPFIGGAVRVVDSRRVGVTLGATVKAPVADTSNYGTGEWDAGATMSMSVLIGRRWSVGLDAGYWHLGDLDNFEFVDPLLGSLSVGLLLDDHWAAMASFAGSTQILTGFDPPLLATIAVSRVSWASRWGLSVGIGLSESAPDVALGLTWAVPLSHGGK